MVPLDLYNTAALLLNEAQEKEATHGARQNWVQISSVTQAVQSCLNFLTGKWGQKEYVMIRSF